MCLLLEAGDRIDVSSRVEAGALPLPCCVLSRIDPLRRWGGACGELEGCGWRVVSEDVAPWRVRGRAAWANCYIDFPDLRWMARIGVGAIGAPFRTA